MRGLLRGVLLLVIPAATAVAAPDGSPRWQVSTGVGAPELVHAELGLFVRPKLTVDVRAANAVFNPMVGAGVTYLMGRADEGDTPRHALMLRLHGMVNPTLGGLRLTSSGDTLGAYAQPAVGYSFLAKNGFALRASVGVLVAASRPGVPPPGDDPAPVPAAPVTSLQTASRAPFGLDMGPEAALSVGWAF